MNTVELSLGSCKPFEFMAPWRSIKAVCANDFALDLGTANTLIYTGEQGIVVNQPSVIAVEEISDKVLAVGHAAKEMLGKTSRAIRCIRPMKDGVVADSQMTALMMRQFLRTARRRRCLFKPQVVIGVPGGTTQVEKRAVIEALHVAGARAVKLVEEPMAAAIGAGLPVDKSIGSMIVDIGGGTTEVAVLTRNETLYSHSIRVAGDEMDEAIQRHLQKNHHLQIGILEAERIKLVIGSALPSGKRRFATVCGRDLST
ncbi:MAG: rod shape-determining protein, partial [Deltaproteobacteria bacterium]|nr:rod shape-determining protein [Deltaproteobacteria bacterium]